jgi:hypothetical protein
MNIHAVVMAMSVQCNPKKLSDYIFINIRQE